MPGMIGGKADTAATDSNPLSQEGAEATAPAPHP